MLNNSTSSILTKVQEHSVDAWLQDKLGPELTKRARAHAQKISVYTFDYTSNGHTVKGFMVAPTSGTNLPSIIYNRGGYKEFGVVTIGQLFVDLAVYTLAGYVVVGSQYSGSPGSEGVDEYGGGELNDIYQLKKIISDYTKCDSERIAMIGESRGGMMTYKALTEVDWISAAIVISGITNFERSFAERQDLTPVYTESFGATKKGFEERSAVSWPEKIPSDVPLLILHGNKDDKVSVKDATELSELLVKNNTDHTLKIFDGGNHGLWNLSQQRDEYILSWLNNNL